ncbi:hypothetical protein M758_UG127500 [Ceratodon purpureus]|nr:hypothetical protein M758_UG127500 [Ceratodon purpureus]
MLFPFVLLSFVLNTRTSAVNYHVRPRPATAALIGEATVVHLVSNPTKSIESRKSDLLWHVREFGRKDADAGARDSCPIVIRVLDHDNLRNLACHFSKDVCVAQESRETYNLHPNWVP